MHGGFLLQAVIYLAAAIFCVPLAKRLGMGSVLGYLAAGIVIGPFLLGIVGEEGKDIMHFSEFGVVMMLFLIGLELEPQKLWKIRNQILGVGLSQVAGTALLIFIIGIASGFSWQKSLAAGLSLAMSSTAIVLQSLKEKGLMQTDAGQNSFAVLLFQDISVIPILAILPLLVVVPVHNSSSGNHSFMENLPGWLQTLSVLGAVGIVIAAGRFIVAPLLRIVAGTRLRELFTASSLLIVLAIAYLMQLVGLSPALGTFLAGVVLANSEYKHELESDLDPFKGLLLGLFFMSVGSSINFHLIAANPSVITVLTAGTIVLKAIILFAIGKIFRIRNDQNLLFSIGLSQIGEFAFVLFSFISQLGIFQQQESDLLMAATAISMTLSPLMLIANEKLVMPRFSTVVKTERQADKIDEKHKVIIAGFSHFGSTLGRFLRANGIEATILDNNPDQVDLLRKMGFKVFYGDATRLDLLESAGAAEANLLISAIDSPEITRDLVDTVQKHFPALEMMIRTRNRFDAYELIDIGVTNIYREHLDTSIRLGVDVLRKLGHRGYTAYRAGQNFIRYDEEALIKLARHRHDKKQYISKVRQEIELQEFLLQNDLQQKPNLNDHVWDGEHMRETIQKIK
jgi:monovalent cation:H+ antiporter-2, CPA2 family